MSRSAAIVKPDHLGDLVLSSPAMRAIWASFGGNVDFYVSSATISLLHFFFPGPPRTVAVDFAHLAKGRPANVDPDALAADLNRHDVVFFLRDDAEMRDIGRRLTVEHVFAEGGHLTHESAVQKRAVSRVIGGYSRTAYFSGDPIFWPRTIGNVGLCVAAGYPTNRWPNAYWIQLANLLAAEGVATTLIGGPGEKADLNLMSRTLGHVPHKVVEGGANFGEFIQRLDQTDIVIASDGGTAHLCSTKKPVMSIFGSSPWRRYAPFGWNNVLLTRDLACSPCVQFSASEVNGCLTRECSAGIRPEAVFRAIMSDGIDFSHVSGVKAYRGVSHRFED